MSLNVLDHPLARHYVTHLRDKTTKPILFRLLANRITLLLAIEASKTLREQPRSIETPMEPMEGSVLEERLVAVPILRAGLGMLEPIVELFPDVSVGYIGLERNEQTAVASSYYANLPQKIAGRTTFVLDPMLATGGSATQAIDLVKSAGAGPIRMLCVVASPEGVDLLLSKHPDVEIFAAAYDRELNDRKYILPGLGDFGDRLYGTFD
ncbi:MAG TPA: uracil phosphoribosyltransferase [Capsulimonadaceae bacterium]|nr:uracil phosphoribosyltransferase [Capsulimonadaceae bacterium]